MLLGRVASSLGALILAACGVCPDLAVPAIRFDIPSEVGSVFTIVADVAPAGSGNLLHDHVPLTMLAQLGAGAYDIVFMLPGVPPAPDTQIGQVSSVCTLGPLAGCEAEYLAYDHPVISFPADGDSYTLTLTVNGPCP